MKSLKLIMVGLMLIFSLTGAFAQTKKNPKNIILLISDGWGYSHVEAANCYQFGQRDGVQIYESFPLNCALSNAQARGSLDGDYHDGYEPQRAWSWFDYPKQKATDSAASATAFSTGVKTYGGAICMDLNQNPLENIVERAESLGKATGVVTSVEWSHATPAAMVAHNISRNNYAEIGTEMIFNSKLDVIMGAGHPLYDHDGQPVATPNTYKYVGGEETWNALVAGIAGNDADGDGRFDAWTLIEDREDFQALAHGATPKRVCGTPKVYQTLQYNRSGNTTGANTTDLPFTDPLIATIPTLVEMTNGALNVLDNDPDGFFLMVEGGAVDWASHGNNTPRMIEEQVDFNNMVQAVVEWVGRNSSWDETLVVVTGDHECGYLTGPGSGPDDVEEGEGTPVWNPVTNNGQGNLPDTEWHSGGHTNTVIPFYAKGPGYDELNRYADETDPKMGKFLKNSEVGQTFLSLWPKQEIVPPKNVILMISDGWGYNHVAATDFYQHGMTGAQVYQSWPVQYAMSTYAAHGKLDQTFHNAYAPFRAWNWFDYVKQYATDSAASATAFSTGVKTYGGSINMDLNTLPLKNVVQLAEEMGRATGVVSSVEWTHATPASMVAHNISRNNYAEIGSEMVFNSKLDVIMGAGHPLYDHDGNPVQTPNTYKYVGGQATWNALVGGAAGNDADNDGIEDQWTLLQDRNDFQKLMAGSTPKRVLGTPKVYQTLQYNRSGITAGANTTDAPYTDPLIETIPTLCEMTKGALNVLDNDMDGFFLMVESGAVDWASHGNNTPRMIEEQIDFNKTVEAVVEWVNENSSWNETLVIVTGDHECGYLTGPGSGTDDAEEGSETPVWSAVVNNGAGHLPGTEWHSGGHTNSLIPLYATGAGSELLHAYADEWDPVRGRFADNAEVGQALLRLYEMSQPGSYVVSNQEFEIDFVRDVPDDEGKQVRIGWTAHTDDMNGKISNYSIYRKITDLVGSLQKSSSIPEGKWEIVATVPAIQTDNYYAVVPTLADSSEDGIYWSYFFVMANTADPTVHYSTAKARGYSVDNKAPESVQILALQTSENANYISWTASEAPDFDRFEIYRGETADFKVSGENLIATTKETFYEDSDVLPHVFYAYKIATKDKSGNKSITPVQVVTSVESDKSIPTRFALEQNYPNPFNPATTIEFSLPKDSHIKLTVYDMQGRQVAQLIDEYKNAGVHKIKWNGSKLSSGLYVYRLEAGSDVMMRKMMLVK